MKSKNAICGENLDMFNGKAGGGSTCRNHWLEGHIEVVCE